jgi:hypothetical protein
MFAVPKTIDWTTLIAGIVCAVVITVLIGLGLWLLLRFHRKKMLEGAPELNDEEDVGQYTRNMEMRKKNKEMREAAEVT